MSPSLTEKTKSGILWLVVRTLGSQFTRIVSSIFLARILMPEDFGIMSIAMITVLLARRFGQFGFTTVLIQKKEIDEKTIRTAFTINLFIYLIITVALIGSAGYVATFFKNPQIKNILIVLSLDFVFVALYSVPSAILIRRMRFKDVSIITLLGKVISFISPVIFAFFGFGVWSLVFGIILAGIFRVFAFNVRSPWKIRLGLSKAAFKDVFSFGVWLNVHSYLKYFLDNIDYFFIGKFLGAAQLGFYERAFNLMSAPRKRMRDMIDEVLFSAYSKIQEDNKRLFKAVDRVVFTISMISYPLLTWFFFAAPAIITILYGPKWTAAIKPLQIMSISGLINTLLQIFYPLILAKGLLKERAIYYLMYLPFLTIGVYIGLDWGIVGVSWAIAITSLLHFVLVLDLLKRKIHFPLRSFFSRQFVAIKYTILPFIIMLSIQVTLTRFYSETSIIMFISLSAGTLIGLILAHLFFKEIEVYDLFLFLLGKRISVLNKFFFGRVLIRLMEVS